LADNGPENKKGSLELFWNEYRLNAKVFHYAKPYIAILDGITMGGGAGISVHGDLCIGTERLRFAMPETGIGFIPDVGGSYFLPRLEDRYGYYLALVGSTINVADACALNIADRVMASENIESFLETLTKSALRDEPLEKIKALLEKFYIDPGQSELKAKAALLQHCFNQESVEAVFDALQKESDSWAEAVLEKLKKRSPLSLKLTFAQLQKGAQLSFDECMRMEYRIVNRILEGHDFYEGVRAQVVDKDRKPHWQPSELHKVEMEAINAFFQPLNEELMFD